jgi:hemolysin activation/secretion protein
VGGEFTDRVVSGTLNLASPTLVGLRLMMRGTVAGRLHDTNNQFYLVGGNTGLRGYPIGFFRGDRQAIGNVELRTGPRRFFFTRVGALAFWDVGHAADRFEALRLHQDVGIGLRALAPQLQPYVFRFDWAIPLTGGVAGFPGRFSAGVQQVF